MTELRCSLCCKTQDQVKKLIAEPAYGPGGYICDRCVDLYHGDRWRATQAWHKALGAYMANELDRAEAEYRVAAELGDKQSRFELAYLLQHELDRPEDAAALYDEGVRAGDSVLIADLGYLLWSRGEVDEAERLLRADAARNPGGPAPYYLRLVLEKEGRNRPEGKREFSRPVALGVGVADTWPLEISYGDATVEEHSGSVAISWESASVDRRPAVQPPHPYEIVAGVIGPELRSSVPAPCLKLRFDEDGGSRSVELLFVDSLAFRWQHAVPLDRFERDDLPYEVINSAWLAEYERWDELERDTSSYRHFRINFNECSGGYLEVLCRAVLLHRPASR